MPYNPAGIREAVSYLDAHNLTPIGNAYDFCYMDATSYNEEHQEDFLLHSDPCCPVNDDERVPFVGLYFAHIENVQVRMRS